MDQERRREMRTEEIKRIAHDAALEAIDTYREQDDTLRWARAQIKAQEERQAMWLKIRDSVLGQIILYATIGIGIAIWKAVTAQVKGQGQ